MKKAIVTTTINAPTEALKKFIEIAKTDDWHLFIVGDKKTPHEEYEKLKLDCVTYITPEMQEGYKELSDAIGWNCIQRRNMGFIWAYKYGAEVIATVDDDNIPHEGWGKYLYVNEKAVVDGVATEQPVFDPLSAVSRELWHRGFPIQLIPGKNNLKKAGNLKIDCLVQADLWDGDPDVDAICRISMHPNIKFNSVPFASETISPFNSQNTFLSRKVFPTYFLFPGIGRMDDIWASYVTQLAFPRSVVYGKASVTQERNEHDLVKDMEAEMIGYKHSLEFVEAKEEYEKLLPEQATKAYKLYKELFV